MYSLINMVHSHPCVDREWFLQLKNLQIHSVTLHPLCTPAASDTLGAASVSPGWARRRSPALCRPRKSVIRVVRVQPCLHHVKELQLPSLPSSVLWCYTALWWTKQEQNTRWQLREQCLTFLHVSLEKHLTSCLIVISYLLCTNAAADINIVFNKQ